MNLVNFLEKRSIPFRVIPHRDTYDAQRLAAAIHVPGREVAKTVLLKANGGYAYIVAVLPADKTIDLERASQVLGGSKLELATELDIKQHCPDCEVGVLPPFGSQYGMKTMVDESLEADDEVVFQGNTHHEAIRMKFEDFRKIEQPLIGSFVREW
jgi:Ala-tRNA(Pro) deacylase